MLDLRVVPSMIMSAVLNLDMLLRVASHAGVDPRFMWIPRAHLDGASLALDAGGKLRVRQHISGVTSGHVAFLPDAGNPQDGGVTRAGAYYEYLRSNRT